MAAWQKMATMLRLAIFKYYAALAHAALITTEVLNIFENFSHSFAIAAVCKLSTVHPIPPATASATAGRYIRHCMAPWQPREITTSAHVE